MQLLFNNNIPIYLQLAEQMKIAILAGTFAPGERLPSVRELALSTRANPNTVQRALQELEEVGLVYTERTNGKFVTQDGALIERLRTEYARELCREYLGKLREVGYTVAHATDCIREESKR